MFSLQSSHAERSSHQIRLHKEYTKNTCTRYWTRKTQNYSLGTVPDLQSHCGRRHIDAYDLEHPDLHFHGQADTVYVLWRRHDGIDFGSLVEDVGAKPRHIPEVISERLRRDGDEHGEQSCDASIRHHCNGGNRQACEDNAFVDEILSITRFPIRKRARERARD